MQKRFHRELAVGGLLFLLLFLVGTLGFQVLEEGWRPLDAFYMTAITLSTVGFGEIYPLSDRGRLFTVFLIFAGLIGIGYMVNRFTEAVAQGYFEEQFRARQSQRLMESLDRHYIVCGYGRTGRQVAFEFQAEGIAFVVVDMEPAEVEKAQAAGYKAVCGDATLDETLLRLGIGRARGVVCALSSDAENLYVVLSAKTLNPAVRVISRASSEEAIAKLQRAGADAAISPYITGGKRLAASALRPQVLDFVDGALSGGNRAFYIEETRLDGDVCPFVGATLSEAKLRSQTGALVIAIRRSDGMLLPGPSAETVLRNGDTLICMGTAEQLRSLNQLLSPLAGPRLPRPPRTPDVGGD
ncbi:MAG: potassium channel protein [Pseudanabaenaceae cyanobacterium]